MWGVNHQYEDTDREVTNLGRKVSDKNEYRLPVCFYLIEKEKCIFYFIRDSKTCPNDEKQSLLKNLTEKNAASCLGSIIQTKSPKTERAAVWTENS